MTRFRLPVSGAPSSVAAVKTRGLALGTVMIVVALAGPARAQVSVQRTRFALPSSNGHAAIVVDLANGARRVQQFREHLYATEEFELDGDGMEIWNGAGFQAVHTRDLLFDTYFGLRGPDGSTWLPDAAIDLDASGYLGVVDDEVGGTGVVTLAQSFGALSATTYAFTPMDLPHAGFVMLLRVRNDGDIDAPAVQAFSLHNFHLGFGRPGSPWEVGEDLAANGETLTHDVAGGVASFRERGFAGAVVVRALAPAAHFGTAPAQNPYAQVIAGGDLGDNAPSPGAVDDAVGAWQFGLGTLSPGEEAWVGVAVGHSGDPFAGDAVEAWLDAWIADRDPASILADERAQWAALHDTIVWPSADGYQTEALRQSIAMLRMGQVAEHEAYLREWLDQDGVPRRTRLPSIEAPAQLPAVVEHHGHGAVLASLPPGNWTYAWIRDGAYAISAMASLGMSAQARAGLEFYLGAESGRFAQWQELSRYDMPPYLVSLVRYLGFGVEETDFNEFGPNLEFDGFGLFLWALANYVDATGDVAFAEDHWDDVSTRVADVILALVEPDTGLLRPDSSIWETHWNGRQRHWTYTNLTAARGLCDAARLAELVGDGARAQSYREAGIALRAAIATRLVDADGALVSNAEELASGSGYYDAAVIEGIAMGLFDPHGAIATATLAGLDGALLTEASEIGWSRNDDRIDHGGGEDLSPWGSDYDAAEWVVTDLRGAIAFGAAGDDARAEAMMQWVTAQTLANYGMVAETYDPDDGTYQFNTPMLGFGAGAYALALAHAGGLGIEPACGAYYEDDGGETGGTAADDSGGSGDGGTASGSAEGGSAEGGSSNGSGSAATNGEGGSDGDTTGDAMQDEGAGGCGCTSGSDAGSGAGWLLIGLAALRRRRRAWFIGAAMLGGCNDPQARGEGDSGESGDVMTTVSASASATVGTADTSGGPTTDASSDGSGDASTGDPTGGMEVDMCPTAFSFEGSGGVTNVRIAGEWQGFDLPTAVAMRQQGSTWRGSVDLPPGLHAYKLVVDDGAGTSWILDPAQGRRKYVDDVENSAVLVPDCNLPTLSVESHATSRPAPGQGQIEVSLAYHDGAPGDGPDASLLRAVLRHDFDEQELGGDVVEVDEQTGAVNITLAGLDDGKYTLVVEAADRGGRRSLPLRLPLWIEPEAFDWRDALVYMVMADRFRNGSAGNDPGPTPGADTRGDFFGGDLQGLRQAIDDGTLDELGVRAIWVSPFHQNPEGAYLASDGVHLVTGYHGYWPVRGREVDERIGGAEALRAMIASAHAHGIRVLQDFVINHVHEDHEYVAEHPDWFRTGCVCGTNGCDWTANALECNFTSYLPDVDHRVPEANAAFVDDAVWWLDAFDLDGLRVDAVKHVEEAATRNLAAAVREGFEQAGTRYFLMGETAMGWNDCPDPCNDENYGTISRYVGPFGLDGQFDFVLYHGVSYRVFGYGDNGMLHADYWLQHGLDKWPEGAIMTPYIGSHDTARFASIADYRGQDGGHDRGVPFHQWSDTAVGPGDLEPYRRVRVAMAWLLGLPGAPLLYYGDEYGQWGGVDPNNRAMWRDEGQLGPWESDTLAFTRLLGQARRELPALRRGDYVSLFASEDTLVFARSLSPGDAAIVALTRADGPQQVDVDVVQLGLQPGVVLDDMLGGNGAVVDGGGGLSLTIPGDGALVLAP